MNLSEQIAEAEQRTVLYRRSSRAHFLQIKRRLKRQLTSTLTLAVVASAALGVGALSAIGRRRVKQVGKPAQHQAPSAAATLMRLATQVAPPLMSAWLLKKKTDARRREAEVTSDSRTAAAAAEQSASQLADEQ